MGTSGKHNIRWVLLFVPVQNIVENKTEMPTESVKYTQ